MWAVKEVVQTTGTEHKPTEELLLGLTGSNTNGFGYSTGSDHRCSCLNEFELVQMHLTALWMSVFTQGVQHGKNAVRKHAECITV